MNHRPSVSSILIAARALALMAAMLIGSSFFGPAAAADEISMTGKSRVQVIYLAAADCPYCRHWERSRGPRDEFAASPLAHEVEFYEARRAHLRDAPSVTDVPKPARWIWDRAWIPRATPAWIVAVDETVVLTVVGLERWEREVRPTIEQLVARRNRLRGAP